MTVYFLNPEGVYGVHDIAAGTTLGQFMESTKTPWPFHAKHTIATVIVRGNFRSRSAKGPLAQQNTQDMVLEEGDRIIVGTLFVD